MLTPPSSPYLGLVILPLKCVLSPPPDLTVSALHKATKVSFQSYISLYNCLDTTAPNQHAPPPPTSRSQLPPCTQQPSRDRQMCLHGLMCLKVWQFPAQPVSVG